jgi:hypothetical protein
MLPLLTPLVKCVDNEIYIWSGVRTCTRFEKRKNSLYVYKSIYDYSKREWEREQWYVVEKDKDR